MFSSFAPGTWSPERLLFLLCDDSPFSPQLGWQLKELVKILKDRPKEVTLLLKKRPRHINPLGAMQNHKKLAAKHAQQAATLPKSLKKRRSREGDAKQPRPSLQEFVSATPAGDDVYITK